MLLLGSPPASADWKKRSYFLQELHNFGWMEGQDMIVEYRWAQGSGRAPG